MRQEQSYPNEQPPRNTGPDEPQKQTGKTPPSSTEEAAGQQQQQQQQ